MLIVHLPLRVISLANARLHWAARNKTLKAHKKAMLAVPPFPLPCVVTLIRLGPKALDDDNLVACFKGCRDGIAGRLGVDDADPRVRWQYDQERSKAYGVRIELREGE
jgi:hypothetical protein